LVEDLLGWVFAQLETKIGTMIGQAGYPGSRPILAQKNRLRSPDGEEEGPRTARHSPVAQAFLMGIMWMTPSIEKRFSTTAALRFQIHDPRDKS